MLVLTRSISLYCIKITEQILDFPEHNLYNPVKTSICKHYKLYSVHSNTHEQYY